MTVESRLNDAGRSTPSDGRSKAWLLGSGLVLCLLLILGLFAFVLAKGVTVFWPKPVDLVLLPDQLVLGQLIEKREQDSLYLTGNVDLTGNPYATTPHRSMTDSGQSHSVRPVHVVAVHRKQWGVLFGFPVKLNEAVWLAAEKHQQLRTLRFLQRHGEKFNAESEGDYSKVVLRAEVLQRRLLEDSLEELRSEHTRTKDEPSLDIRPVQQVLEDIADPAVRIASSEFSSLEQVIKVIPGKVRQQNATAAKAEVLRGEIQTADEELESLQRLGFANDEKRFERIVEYCRSRLSLESESRQVAYARALELSFAGCAKELRDMVALIEHRIQRESSELDAAFELDASRDRSADPLVAIGMDVLRRQSASRAELDRVQEELRGVNLHFAVVGDTTDELKSNQRKSKPNWRGSELGTGLELLQQGDLDNLELRLSWKVDERVRQEYSLQLHEESLDNVVRVIPINQLTTISAIAFYMQSWSEFLLTNPREANTAGGMFPAIWGTVVLTLIMTVAVVPLGVIAALYLREYTSEGPLVSLIRISIYNLAGVPSIVYGVFGVAFFCYTLGAFIDGGPANADIEPLTEFAWYSLLAFVSVLGTVSFFTTILLARCPRSSNAWLPRIALFLWLICLGCAIALVFKNPFFEGVFAASLPNPTFGKGGIIWAAFTLALLTLPIVIVCTEEALESVPNSLRVGSSACGANKWQTIWRVVLPQALPGVFTGALLAMARGTGQVAPLMLVGALPSVADLPVDGEFPYFHGSRSFMHLGYQIYFLGLKSDDAQATEPAVFAAILVLLVVVCILHFVANSLRSRVRRRITLG